MSAPSRCNRYKPPPLAVVIDLIALHVAHYLIVNDTILISGEGIMPKRTKVSGTATPEEIEAVYKGSSNPHDQRRLIALQMAHQGAWVLAEIGEQ